MRIDLKKLQKAGFYTEIDDGDEVVHILPGREIDESTRAKLGEVLKGYGLKDNQWTEMAFVKTIEAMNNSLIFQIMEE